MSVCQCDIRLLNSKYFCKKIKNKPAMIYFLNIMGKTHAEDTLQSLFDDKLSKNCNFRFQYSVEDISPPVGLNVVPTGFWLFLTC